MQETAVRFAICDDDKVYAGKNESIDITDLSSAAAG